MQSYMGTLDLNTVQAALKKYDNNVAAAARQLGVPRSTLWHAARWLKKQKIADTKDDVYVDTKKDKCLLTHRSKTVCTLEAALEAGDVDLEEWEVERWVLNKWDCLAKATTEEGKTLGATELWQVKVWLRKKDKTVRAIEKLLDELKNNKLKLPTPKSKKYTGQISRELELSIMDPHLGMLYSPNANDQWDLDICEDIVLNMVEELLTTAQYYAPFKQIVFPLGNDFFHSDNSVGTTTKGTLLPDATDWHEMVLRGEKLVFAIIERLLEEAPVKVIVVAGNHDKHSTFMLGRIVNARYNNAEDVEVVCDASPYKFHKFGVNLIGYVHNQANPGNKLAALMANETRTSGWADARYCEWHLGDQHRKGSARPTVMEEQGVSIEYLPGLVPANEWHKMHMFNWQKRAGMAFVWDETRGPIARLQVNIDNYTGDFMGY